MSINNSKFNVVEVLKKDLPYFINELDKEGKKHPESIQNIKKILEIVDNEKKIVEEKKENKE